MNFTANSNKSNVISCLSLYAPLIELCVKILGTQIITSGKRLPLKNARATSRVRPRIVQTDQLKYPVQQNAEWWLIHNTPIVISDENCEAKPWLCWSRSYLRSWNKWIEGLLRSEVLIKIKGGREREQQKPPPGIGVDNWKIPDTAQNISWGRKT